MHLILFENAPIDVWKKKKHSQTRQFLFNNSQTVHSASAVAPGLAVTKPAGQGWHVSPGLSLFL